MVVAVGRNLRGQQLCLLRYAESIASAEDPLIASDSQASQALDTLAMFFDLGRLQTIEAWHS